MGDRCLTEETAGADDIQAMADIAEEALKAGALGFSTSRTVLHRTAEGDAVPGTYAGRNEMLGIASGIAKASHGVLQMANDMADEVEELGWMGELSKQYKVPVSMNVFQRDSDPLKYRRVLEGMQQINNQGGQLTAQVSALAGWHDQPVPVQTDLPRTALSTKGRAHRPHARPQNPRAHHLGGATQGPGWRHGPAIPGRLAQNVPPG